MLVSHGATNARGVTILLHRHLSIKIKRVTRHINGRFIIMDIEYESKNFTLVNVYVPNTDEPEFFVSLIKAIEQHEISNLIIGGDFN